MILHKTILILEDNLKVLSSILDKLSTLEMSQPYEFSLIILTTQEQVENYINTHTTSQYDIILLDRDCKLGKSFHILDIERFGADSIISISSVPKYNREAQERGVRKVILKDLQNIEEFATKVVGEVEKIITPARLRNFLNDYLDT